MTATYTLNPNYNNSIQIVFDSIPAVKIRDQLKSFRFRWHHRDKYWYASNTAERLAFAQSLCGIQESETEKEEPKKEKAKTNKFGVQVGDIFSCSWGYDQTNVDFFQVLKLCGEKSIRVRQVQPKLVSEKAGFLSADRTYEITSEILPPSPYTVFITDQENGDLKRLKSWNADGISDPIFEVGSGGYICHKVAVGQHEYYESWGH